MPHPTKVKIGFPDGPLEGRHRAVPLLEDGSLPESHLFLLPNDLRFTWNGIPVRYALYRWVKARYRFDQYVFHNTESK